ncbi:MAG: isoprenylcysteine carboxylmethyltransferase family protein [Limimaricola sp.]|uniref:methyltransferase family protein n=1 Tax=Limimaricola sp. TaxID=2211665 RepID=UPI001D7427BB|nr:isoprenylcysteine carboxylmethyltransferase family protein [Limimaricola sp.]MBI1418530.1 isoprenylcysteine carboxylmethyltransferase family protein [Limimaricola sp.]
MRTWIDIPPAWLIAALALAWGIGRADPWGLSFGGAWADFAAGLCIGGGLILMLLAVIEMRKWRTTVIPHREAAHLVTSGIFKRTRNPIYLGDALVLLGAILRFDAPLALPLVPVFVWWIERHFIIAEERRLRGQFKAEFARYCTKTRRWL